MNSIYQKNEIEKQKTLFKGTQMCYDNVVFKTTLSNMAFIVSGGCVP